LSACLFRRETQKKEEQRKSAAVRGKDTAQKAEALERRPARHRSGSPAVEKAERLFFEQEQA
jgi:hypothetical protein